MKALYGGLDGLDTIHSLILSANVSEAIFGGAHNSNDVIVIY